ncbi:hypothetical protein PSCICN_17250 [Pseudomonas cichorii]|nr:hypothetical protein PSCICN_17250 [Pseudomonas cichorii]
MALLVKQARLQEDIRQVDIADLLGAMSHKHVRLAQSKPESF